MHASQNKLIVIMKHPEALRDSIREHIDEHHPEWLLPSGWCKPEHIEEYDALEEQIRKTVTGVSEMVQFEIDLTTGHVVRFWPSAYAEDAFYKCTMEAE
jgi:hypothetical protein